MVQLVTKVDDDLASAIDALIRSGRFSTRSEVVRAGLMRIVDEARRTDIGAAIVRGYLAQPETDEELAQARRASVAMILEEPW
jgi:Arc/MetJ-type ribon-helix-helix transcriptional regulator